MDNTLKNFCQKIGITEDQLYGKEQYKGSLDLRSLTSVPEGFNPTVGGYLDLSRLTSVPEGFNPTVGGSLYLRGPTSIPEGFNPTVGGSLDLNSLTSVPEGFNPTVGGSLCLRSLTSVPEGFNPTVGGSLYLSALTSIPEGFNPTVGGSLFLNGLTSIPEGFNPTVGGSLYLRSLTSVPEGFNPTVGGSLYLSRLTSVPEGFNPTVGGSLYLRHGEKYIGSEVNIPEVYTWQNGKYIKADDIFMEVVRRKGNVYVVRKINKPEESYLVADGKGKWAHGNTLEEAKADLIYKISDRDKSDYEHLTLESELTFEDAIEAYRVITGACSFGTKDFVENRLEKKKSSYKISEMIQLTEDEYGSKTFRSFFKK